RLAPARTRLVRGRLLGAAALLPGGGGGAAHPRDAGLRGGPVQGRRGTPIHRPDEAHDRSADRGLPFLAASRGCRPVRMNDSFEDLARYYDRLMVHVDYDRWYAVAGAIAGLLPRPFLHVDLACGTGTLLRK